MAAEPQTELEGFRAFLLMCHINPETGAELPARPGRSDRRALITREVDTAKRDYREKQDQQ